MAPVVVVVVVLGVGDDDVMQPEMDTGMGVGWSKSEKNNARMVCSAPGPPPLAASRGLEYPGRPNLLASRGAVGPEDRDGGIKVVEINRAPRSARRDTSARFLAEAARARGPAGDLRLRKTGLSIDLLVLAQHSYTGFHLARVVRRPPMPPPPAR